MTIQLPLTAINGTRGSKLEEFASYLHETGRAEKTVSIYRKLLGNYFAISGGERFSTGMTWLSWDAPSQMKRLAGYALRVYKQFLVEFYPELASDFFVPSRLPPASRPNPQPLDSPDALIKKLCITARRIFPKETANSLRVFIHLLRELGVRRSEAAGIHWSDVDWRQKSILIHGKGGTKRILPMSRKLSKLLNILRRRSAVSPWIGARDQVLSGDVLAHLLKKLAHTADVPTLHCHKFRTNRLTEIGNSKEFNEVLYCAFAGHDLAAAKYYLRPKLERLRSMTGIR